MRKVDLTNPGIQLQKFPTFEDRKAHFSHLPDLNLRFAFCGPSSSAGTREFFPQILRPVFFGFGLLLLVQVGCNLLCILHTQLYRGQQRARRGLLAQ